MIVLIPAYEPDEKLARLAELLRDADVAAAVLVVDDGSGPAYAKIFDQVRTLGCTVIGHEVNRGKGYALKRGFAFIEQHHPGHDVVCADCDGQHSIVDIARIAGVVAASDDDDAMVLGTRRFTGQVPLASRVGNSLTRVLFARSTGRRVFDTQTGLRGYPASMLPWLQQVGGDRFEYELNTLLHGAGVGMSIHEVPIETIYLDDNASTHFRPIVDSVRVYAPLAKFSLSSLGAFGVDLLVLFTLDAATGDLLLSVVGARVVSSIVNFATNRRLVFGGEARRSLGASAARYFGLAGVVLTANYGLMHLLHERLGVALLPSKLVTEVLLFALSYQAQKRVVFGRRRGGPHAPSSPGAAATAPAPVVTPATSAAGGPRPATPRTR